jgi:hypothetical protein
MTIYSKHNLFSSFNNRLQKIVFVVELWIFQSFINMSISDKKNYVYKNMQLILL